MDPTLIKALWLEVLRTCETGDEGGNVALDTPQRCGRESPELV
jgi:hypothetical protein